MAATFCTKKQLFCTKSFNTKQNNIINPLIKTKDTLVNNKLLDMSGTCQARLGKS